MVKNPSVVVVGDLHCKYHIFEAVKKLVDNYDRIIFMGDYVDDWNTPPEASYNLLMGLKELYKEHPSKVVYLLGNHEISEWYGNNFKCSGWNHITHQYVEDFMFKFSSIFRLAYAEQGFLFTHAGLTGSWIDKYLEAEDLTSVDTIAKKLNWAFKNRGDDYEARNIFMGLSDVGMGRGGYGTPSPIWADINELLEDTPTELNQIVGHTPIHTCLHYTNRGSELFFCDTHSTFPDKANIGDNSLLQVNGGYVRKIALDGTFLPW